MKTSQNQLQQSTLSSIGLDEYQQFVDSHPASTVFHHRRWIELLSNQHGLKVHIPAVKENGQIVGAIPFLETRNIWAQRKLVSLPFTDSVSLLANHAAVSKLRRHLQSDAFGDYSTILIRTDTPTSPESADPAWVQHTVNLESRFSDVYDRFERRLKTNLRRADSNNLTFSCHTSTDAMQAFYELQVKTRRKIGIPVQPRRFFEGLRADVLDEDLGFIGLVECDNRTIAAGVFLVYNGTMVFKYSAADPTALSLRPNEFMTHQAMRYGSELGCRVFDFGISRKEQDGLRRFKLKFGSFESPVYGDFIVGNKGKLPEESKAMAIASLLIKNSPKFVCKALGETFYKYSQ